MTPQLQQAIKLLQLSNLELVRLCRGRARAESAARARRPVRPIRAEPAAAPAEPAPEGSELWHDEAGSEGEGKLDLAGDPEAWRKSARRPWATTCPASTRPWCGRRRCATISWRSSRSRSTSPPTGSSPATSSTCVDEAGYVTGELAADRRAARLPGRAHRGDACRACSASTRPASSRAISPNAWRFSSRSATASTRRCSGWSRTCRCSPAATRQQLMRICGVDAEDLAHMVAEIKALDPKPGLIFDSAMAGAASCPTSSCAPQADGGWAVELNSDTLPRVLVNNRYYAEVSGASQQARGARLSRRALSVGQLAGEGAASARHHHPQSRARDRAPAGRLPAPRRAASAPAGAARHRAGDQHAREHREPRHLEQIHADAARHLRAEIFLHLGDLVGATAAARFRPRRCGSASSR